MVGSGIAAGVSGNGFLWESRAGVNENPVLVEVTRGAIIKSRDRGAFVMIEESGKIVQSVSNPQMQFRARL